MGSRAIHVLLGGARGNLGQAFQDFFRANQISFEVLYWESFDAEELHKRLELKPSHLINAAAVSSRDYSKEHPIKTWEANVAGVWKQLEMCRIHSPTTRVCQFGSTYEDADNQWDKSPYACSKRMMRELVEAYRKLGLWVLRPVLGFTEYKRGPGFLTSKIVGGAAKIAAAVREGKPFEPLQLHNIDEKMRFAYGMDVVESVWSLMAAETPVDVEMEGEEVSVRDFTSHVFAAMGMPLTWEYHFSFPEHVERGVWYYEGRNSHSLVEAYKKWATEYHCTVPITFDNPEGLEKLFELTRWKPKTSIQEMVTKLVQKAAP